MDDDSQQLDAKIYRYTEVRDALAIVHGVYPASLVAIRGRIQAFQKLGLAPSQPGKGQRIRYSFEDVCKWAYALEFSEIGIDPTAIYSIVSRTWIDVYEKIRIVMDYDRKAEYILAIKPDIMRRSLRNIQEIEYFIFKYESQKQNLEKIDRMIIINISEIRRGLLNAFNQLQAPEPPVEHW